MLVSYNWLQNYVDLQGLTPEELAAKITKSGIEVEGVEYVAAESKGIVVGYVVSCEQHPNADKLNLCQVDIGDEENLQIICGAPNIAQGQKVAVATPGAVLPGNFKIKKVKLRGIESNGMICSLGELGIDEKYIPTDIAEGIFVFPDYVEVGAPAEGYLNLRDAVLDLDILANRADALSLLGVAYEVGAVLNEEVQLPEESVEEAAESVHDYVSVEVEAKDLNPYYGAFLLRDVQIKESPLWMRNYLMAAGIRPINNVVDITNYVLLEYGQPLHAFDYDKFASETVVVRRAKDGEKLVTLDDQERTLTEENLVITNGEVPVALAGVMGGADTEVTTRTKNVLLEAAYFNGASVRTTVKQTGLRSESSTRFEKGVDPNRVKNAGYRAASLMQQYANATVVTGVAEFDQLDRTGKKVDVSTERVNDRLGTSIEAVEIAGIFDRLKFEYEQDGEQFTVHIPTRRGDIAIFEDMLEEIARIHGYDHLPYTLPESATKAGGLTELQQLKRSVKGFMEAAGLMETLTYSLVSEADINKLVSPEVKERTVAPVSLAMPMSADHKYLRQSLLPGLLHTLSYNQARNQYDIHYYEMAKVFISEEQETTKQPIEENRLSAVLSGNWLEHKWQQDKKEVDFYLVKGIVEELFERLELSIAFEQAKLDGMHPGRTALVKLEDKTIGFIGQIHPQYAKDMDIRETYVIDLNMEAVFTEYHVVPSFTEVPKYPSITRDIAFIMDEETEAGVIQKEIEQIGTPLVKQVDIFDVYQGEHLEEGKKSVAYSLVYQDANKTLQDDEVEASYDEILAHINEKFNTYVRS